MTGPIGKIDAAWRQLDCSIDILDKEDLAAQRSPTPRSTKPKT
jgi:hypothetical protein